MFFHGRTQFALTHNNTNRIMPEIAGQARNDGRDFQLNITIKFKNIKINGS